jgi:hypothetical protein
VEIGEKEKAMSKSGLVGRDKEGAAARADWLRNWARGVWYQVNADLVDRGYGTISAVRFWKFIEEEAARRRPPV